MENMTPPLLLYGSLCVLCLKTLAVNTRANILKIHFELSTNKQEKQAIT